MSLRTWLRHACVGTLIILLAACGGGSTTAGSSAGTNSTGNSGGSGSNPVVSGVSTPKSVSVVTAN
jgi:hypothetical protein